MAEYSTKIRVGLTLEKLRNIVAPLLNDVCLLYDTDIGRLVGIAEDADDYYYVVDMPKHGRIYYSAAGRFFSLKNSIPTESYQYMDALLSNNGFPPVSHMLIVNYTNHSEIHSRPVEVLDNEYARGVRDAANVIFNLPHTKAWQEITDYLSDTDTQALAWRSGVAVLALLDKPKDTDTSSN